MLARRLPQKTEPTPPEEDMIPKLDPDHTDEDVLDDLDRALRRGRDARCELDDPARCEREA